MNRKSSSICYLLIILFIATFTVITQTCDASSVLSTSETSNFLDLTDIPSLNGDVKSNHHHHHQQQKQKHVNSNQKINVVDQEKNLDEIQDENQDEYLDATDVPSLDSNDSPMSGTNVNLLQLEQYLKAQQKSKLFVTITLSIVIVLIVVSTALDIAANFWQRYKVHKLNLPAKDLATKIEKELNDYLALIASLEKIEDTRLVQITKISEKLAARDTTSALATQFPPINADVKIEKIKRKVSAILGEAYSKRDDNIPVMSMSVLATIGKELATTTKSVHDDVTSIIADLHRHAATSAAHTTSAVLGSVMHYLSPIFSLVSASVGFASSTYSFVDVVKRCSHATKLYEQEKEMLLRDAKYTLCKVVGKAMDQVSEDMESHSKMFAELPDASRTDLEADWTQYVTLSKQIVNTFKTYYGDKCKVFTQVPRSDLPPIRKMWGGSTCIPTKREHVKAIELEVVNQPSFLLYKKSRAFTLLEYYQPDEAKVAADRVEQHKMDNPTDVSGSTTWTYGFPHVSPITHMVQRFMDGKLVNLDPNYIVYDSNELTYKGLFHSDAQYEPLMDSELWANRRDARIETRKICNKYKPEARTPVQNQRCSQLNPIITTPEGKVKDNPFYIENLSIATWKKDGYHGNAPYYTNFIRPAKHRSLVDKCVGPVEEEAPYLLLYYQRAEFGAPIVDLRALPSSAELSAEAKAIKATKAALKSAISSKALEPTKSGEKTKAVGGAGVGSGTADTAKPVTKDTGAGTGLKLTTDDSTPKANGGAGRELPYKIVDVSDSEVCDVSSHFFDRIDTTDATSWYLVPYAVDELSCGCPNIYIPVQFKKDYHLPTPNALKSSTTTPTAPIPTSSKPSEVATSSGTGALKS